MTSRVDPHAWDHTWDLQLAAAAVPLDRPTHANVIDEGKLAFLAPDLPRSGRAVEVGCGSARLLARVGRAAGLELVAMDASPSALHLAACTAGASGTSLHRVRADALALPLADASCDLVLSGGLLEHFADPRPVLAEMVRILRPGGTFYADVVPRKVSFYRVREAPRILRSPWLLPGVYESPLGPGPYRRLLGELGCEAIRTRGAGFYPPVAAPLVARLARGLDGTFLADWLGWYFMIVARRAGGPRVAPSVGA